MATMKIKAAHGLALSLPSTSLVDGESAPQRVVVRPLWGSLLAKGGVALPLDQQSAKLMNRTNRSSWVFTYVTLPSVVVCLLGVLALVITAIRSVELAPIFVAVAVLFLAEGAQTGHRRYNNWRKPPQYPTLHKGVVTIRRADDHTAQELWRLNPDIVAIQPD